MALSNAEELRRYADECTNDAKAGTSQSGNSANIQFLSNIKERLGESKLLNDPIFFYWKLPISNLTLELCGYDIDEINNSLTLFSSDFGESFHSVTKETVDKLGGRAVNFVKCALKENKQLADKIENEALDLYDWILSERDKISKVSVIIVSNGISTLRKRENKAEIEAFKIDVEYILWDVSWIYENCKQEKEHEAILLDFTDEDLSPFVDQGGLPYLSIPQAEDMFDCYQCVVPGRLLSYIYRKYGTPILEGNVRSFLSTKVAVNRQILDTIKNQPTRFYIYNNGIAAVASDVKTKMVNGVPKIIEIYDFQIINGGQTTASLALGERKRDYDLTSIYVPMKLTIIHRSDGVECDLDSGEENFSEIIQKISRTSNSQNKVSDADFFSNHKFHLNMKKYSQDLVVPGLTVNTYWFYERARGEYAQKIAFMTETEKKNFLITHPKEKYLTKTDFAKYYELYNLRPDIVSRGGVANFNEFAKFINSEYDNKRSGQFNEIFFKEVAGVALMYRTLEPLITKKNQSWFEGSYRANVLNYAISLFFYLLKQQSPQNGFDMTVVWDRGISQKLQDQLLELCRLVYFKLIDPSRSVVNVTQWAKKEDCWKDMKQSLGNTKLDLESIKGYLKDKYEIQDEKKIAKQNQVLVQQVDVYKKAFSKELMKVWLPLFNFVSKNKKDFEKIGQYEEQALSRMARCPKVTPSEEDCKIALDILEEAKLLGFVTHQ